MAKRQMGMDAPRNGWSVAYNVPSARYPEGRICMAYFVAGRRARAQWMDIEEAAKLAAALYSAAQRVRNDLPAGQRAVNGEAAGHG